MQNYKKSKIIKFLANTTDSDSDSEFSVVELKKCRVENMENENENENIPLCVDQPVDDDFLLSDDTEELEEDNRFKPLTFELVESGKDNFIHHKEIIDVDKLNYIVENREEFEPLLHDRFRYDGYDPMLASENYLKKYLNGAVDVSYKQKKNIGRFHSVGGLSLQSLTRKIRHTIARDFYVDVDMVNAHPVILEYLLNVWDIDHPNLTKYIENREKILEIMNVDRDKGKKTFLAVMNGGFQDYDSIGKGLVKIPDFWDSVEKKPKILIKFRDEMLRIHTLVAKKFKNKFETHKAKRIKNGIDFNHEASFINIFLCDFENRVLQTIYNFIGKPSDCVLCFDGIMIRKDQAALLEVSDIEQEIRDKLVINMKIKIKSMDEHFDLSDRKISKYKEKSFEYFGDYENLIGNDVSLSKVEYWKNSSLTKIINRGKMFVLTKNKEVHPKTKEVSISYEPCDLSADLSGNLNVNCKILNEKYDYNFAQEFSEMKPKEIKKLSEEQLLTTQKYLYKDLMTGNKKVMGYIDYCFRNGLINTFESVDFIPYLARKGAPELYKTFNLWGGFPLEKVKLSKKYKFEDTLFYKHLNEVMFAQEKVSAGVNPELEHFLDWVADLIQDPANSKGSAHWFCSDQGMGKGLLVKWIKRLIGRDHYIEYTNAETYFEKHNASMRINKLFIVFEELAEKGSVKTNHNQIKGDITKDELNVNPKNVKPFTVSFCARFLFNTNNPNSLYVEKDDRRMTLHRIKKNTKIWQNNAYFDPMWEEMKNEQIAKSVFEFFANREYDVGKVRKPYESNFKLAQKEVNLPVGLKFLIEVSETRFEGFSTEGSKIKCKDLSLKYKDWCSENGCKFNVSSLKTQLEKLEFIEKSLQFGGRKAKCYKIDAEMVEKRLKEYLKNPAFKLDYVGETTDEEECPVFSTVQKYIEKQKGTD